MSVAARVEREPAYVLHTRAYRETSQIVEVFTHRYGRVGVIARGARRPRSNFRGLLNVFQPLRIGWAGRGELPALRDAEFAGQALSLTGDRLLAAFYLNELLLKLLQRSDPHPELFVLYTRTMATLAEDEALEPQLRRFELGLLQELGYAPNLVTDVTSGAPLEPQQYYEYRVAEGASAVANRSESGLCFSGAELLAIHAHDFTSQGNGRAARRLLRYLINYYVGGRGLQTRRIAAAMKR